MKQHIKKNFLAFYNVYYIKRNKLFNSLGLNIHKNRLKIKIHHVNNLSNNKSLLDLYKTETEKAFGFISNIKNYIYTRKNLGYPARGQRTHTNAKTQRKKKQNLLSKNKKYIKVSK